jgi:hypothetical protein
VKARGMITVTVAAAVAVLAAVGGRLFPDVRRYLRMRSM